MTAMRSLPIVLLGLCGLALPLRGAAESQGSVAPADPEVFVAHLSGDQERPSPVTTLGLGLGLVILDPATSTIQVRLRFQGLGSNQTLAHIHGPAAAGANAGVLFDLGSQGSTSGFYSGQSFQLTPQQLQDLRNGLHYFNVHTQTFPGGEIRGQILPETLFEAFEIVGAQEAPTPVASAGRGFGIVSLNAAATQIRASLAYSGLGSNQTMGHIHGAAAAGSNAGVLFNIGSSGQTSGTFANLTFNVTPTQVQQLRQGLFYFNVHSVNFSGGEIRGQIDGVLRDGVE